MITTARFKCCDLDEINRSNVGLQVRFVFPCSAGCYKCCPQTQLSIMEMLVYQCLLALAEETLPRPCSGNATSPRKRILTLAQETAPAQETSLRRFPGNVPSRAFSLKDIGSQILKASSHVMRWSWNNFETECNQQRFFYKLVLRIVLRSDAWR